MKRQEEENNENAADVNTQKSLNGLESKEHSIGQIAGIVIIVSILVLGGLYFWGNQYFSDRSNTEPLPNNIMVEVDPVVESLGSQDISDDLNSIEKDLDTTDFGNIDEDFSNIDTVFDQ